VKGIVLGHRTILVVGRETRTASIARFGRIGSARDRLQRRDDQRRGWWIRSTCSAEFDRAWLEVPVQPRDGFVWYGEHRILLDSSQLEDIRVHVELRTSVEVTATFPDGSIANRNELLLACAEAYGGAGCLHLELALRVQSIGRCAYSPAAGKRALKTRSPRYVGDVMRTFEFGRSVARVQVRSSSIRGMSPPNADPGPMEDATALPSWVQPALRLTVRDTATGPLDRTLVNVDGAIEGPWSVDGRREVRLNSGWSVIEIGSGGHRSRWFRDLCRRPGANSAHGRPRAPAMSTGLAPYSTPRSS